VTETKALVLVGIGTLLLSAGMDFVLLKMHADGTALAVALVVPLAIASVATTLVMRRYRPPEERRR